MNKPFCIAIMAGLVTPLVANANLLVNGSFEKGDYTGIPGGDSWTDVPGGGTAIDGWTAKLAGCDWHQAWSVGGEFGPAKDGTRMIDLTFDLPTGGTVVGGIAQSFATVPGETYQLTFAMTAPSGPWSNPAWFDVNVAGLTHTYSVARSDRYDMTWQIETLDFTAVSDLTTLEFLGQTSDYWGAVIDEVCVTGKGVPDAGSCLGLLAISSGLLLALRRRSH